ncbi:hypothetical protein QN239_26525 [Mycolicibacterium sp. Y3]
MNRKSASLTAGVCSLCITASLVTAPPHAAAAATAPAVQHRTVSTLEQPYELTASIDQLLAVAGLPLNNLNTTINTVGQLLVFVKGLNLAMGHLYTGAWGSVPADLLQAWTDEQKAIQNVIALPAKLIAYDLSVIGGAFGATATAATAAKSGTAVATASAGTTVTGIATLLSLPLQNFNTAVNTVGQLLVFIKGLNSAMGHLYTGDWAAIPTDLAKAFTDEVTAIKNVFALPGKLIAYDLGVIRGAVGATATVAAATTVTSSRVQTLALTAAPSTAGSTGKTAEETSKSGTETKDGTDATDTTEVKDTTETKDPTETKDTTTEVKDPTEVKDTTTEVKTPTDEKTSTETKDTTGTGTTTAGSASGTSTDTTGDKTGDTAGAKDATDGKGSTTGKQGTGKKGSTYGKHARQDDGTNSTASASTGTTKTSTGVGRHRKPEGASSEGSSSSASASSAGGSSAAA